MKSNLSAHAWLSFFLLFYIVLWILQVISDWNNVLFMKRLHWSWSLKVSDDDNLGSVNCEKLCTASCTPLFKIIFLMNLTADSQLTFTEATVHRIPLFTESTIHTSLGLLRFTDTISHKMLLSAQKTEFHFRSVAKVSSWQKYKNAKDNETAKYNPAFWNTCYIYP